jgi:glycosyltransferase involved in cell wall biosynthesis
MKQHKIIQIFTHSLSNIFPNLDLGQSLPYDGGWHVRLTNQLLRYTDKYDIECWSIERKIKTPIVYKNNKIICRIFPSKRFKYFGEVSIPLLKSLKDEVKKQNVLIHLHGVFNYTTFLIPLIVKKVPIIVQHHGDKSTLQSALEQTNFKKKIVYFLLYLLKFEFLLERLAFRKINYFLVLNEQAETYLQKIVGSERIKKLTMGVDFDLFKKIDKEKARSLLNLDLEKKYILYVGSFVKLKGLDYLFKALPLILKNYNDCLLILVGDGYYKKELIDLSIKLAIHDKIIFFPWLKNEVLPLFYNAADVCILPSLDEGLGLTGIEALACERPFIGTNVGGIPSVIMKFNAGILIPAKSHEAIANAIMETFKKTEKIVVNRENAKKYYDWKNIVQKTLDLYDELFVKFKE